MLRVGVQPDGMGIEQHRFVVHLTISRLERARASQRPEDNRIKKRIWEMAIGRRKDKSLLWADKEEKTVVV